jgi:hypothetical protein
MIQGNVYKLYNVVSFRQILKNASQVIKYLDKRPDYIITNNVTHLSLWRKWNSKNVRN